MDAVNSRLEVLEARVSRINHCLKRDAGEEAAVAALKHELEAREAELKFIAFKAT